MASNGPMVAGDELCFLAGGYPSTAKIQRFCGVPLGSSSILLQQIDHRHA
ncbi:hypothetical protein SynBOUM118_01027 [Synechococcus sp. BOUM118]|nr:hypothetical protein SynBOUM118_01027 [Synechococcus sp. BOUM118]